MSQDPPRTSSRQIAAVCALAILAAGGWAFLPALANGWVWDDSILVTENPLLRSVGGLAQMWAGKGTPDYFPLTSTVLWIEWHLWGLRPAGYHAVNIVLHLLSALLFWRLLRRLAALARGNAPAPAVDMTWIGGLFFAVHPLMVESVAWVSELKNVLSLFLLLLAFAAYLAWDTTPREKRRQLYYILSALLFLASMLAKTSVVMAPVVLLVYDYWRRARLSRRDLLSKIPFFAISLAFGLITVWFQKTRGMEAGVLPLGGAASRAATAGIDAWFYLGKFFAPLHLLPVYPRWGVEPATLKRLLPLLAGIAALGWLAAGGGGRTGVFGTKFCLLNLLPVLGFLPVAYFHISWVADHFAYLPALGVFGLAAAAAIWLQSRLPGSAVGSLALGFAVFWAGLSHSYAKVFRDSETLWRYTLAREPESWTARNNLGKVLLKRGRAEEAAPLLESALTVCPPFAASDIDLNLSLAYAREGRPFEAVSRCQEAIRLRPGNAEAHSNLAGLYARIGRSAEAVDEDAEAVRLDPSSAILHDNLSVALSQAGRVDEAIAQGREAMRLDPSNIEARYNTAVALGHAGRNAEAAEQFEEVIQKEPDRADAHNNLGIVLVGLGRLAEARAEFAAALRLQPDLAQAAQNYERATRALSAQSDGQ